MRIALLLLVPALAAAESRVGLHAAGGLELSTQDTREPPPSLQGEVGFSVDWLRGHTGLGVNVERSVRSVREREYKVDVLFRVRHPKTGFVSGFGIGVRRYEEPGEGLRPSSTIWGADLVRVNAEWPLARVGRVSIDFYIAWSFGLYHGDHYGDRTGDMAFPVTEKTTIANAYVLGLATSFYTNP